MSVKSVQAVINGQTYTLTLNPSTGKYEATVTAPAKSSYTQEGHYYPVSVTAEDDAGNTTTKDATDTAIGESLQLRVKEKVAPVILVTYPTSAAYLTNAAPEIMFKVTDDDSGVDAGTIRITVDGNEITSGITKNPVTGGFECTYTPETVLADGEHTISVNASDNDGNAATAKTVTFTVDTVPPALSVENPAEGLVTNETELVVSGATSDTTSKPVIVTVNGEEVAVNEDGSFSKTVNLSSGANVITVIATDKAGKSTTVTRNVTLDTGAPVIHSITLTPNPVDTGKTFIISVEVTD